MSKNAFLLACRIPFLSRQDFDIGRKTTFPYKRRAVRYAIKKMPTDNVPDGT